MKVKDFCESVGMYSLDEANFMNKNDLIKEMGTYLDKDGVIQYKMKYFIFDVSQAVQASKNKGSTYAKTMAMIINSFNKKRPENVEFPNMVEKGKGYLICLPDGKSIKNTYAEKDYFFDDLDAVLGVFKESRYVSVMQQILDGVSVREALSE